MATREEEDMEIDGVSSTVPEPLYKYRWTDYALSDPRVCDSNFIYENIGVHKWKLTKVQYELMRYFCSQEEEKLKNRYTSDSAYIYSYTHTIESYGSVLSEEIVSTVKDIESKISQLCFVEMNRSVSDDLRFNSSFMRKLNTADCLVCVPDGRICIFGSSVLHLYNAFEALCTEFEKRNGSSSGTNFKLTRNPDLSVDRSYSSTTSSTTASSSVSNNQENHEAMIGLMRVKVNNGSILDAKVEAIVNAANESLTFDAGVSRVIHKAAGSVYEMECKNLLKKEDSFLQTSKCYASGPGRLAKFKCILHAVGPCWIDYDKKEDCIYLLANTVKNVLKLADSLQISSIAMPAISSGRFSVPVKLCASAYIIGLCKFGAGKTLREVHFVDTDPLVVNEIKTACSKYEENPLSITPETLKSMYPAYFTISSDNTKNVKSITTTNASSIQPLQFKEGSISVKVYQGSVLKVKAEALVNAANEGLSHGAGVALAIRDAAGEDFDKECQSKLLSMNGSLRTTRVLTTSSANLKDRFKYILNAVGPIWSRYSDKTQCLSDLHDTIVNILNEAEKLCVRTLVMPAISCGIFGVPLKLCAEMYLQGIINFCRQTTLYLKEIHIVDIDISVLREMTDAYYNYKQNPDSISIRGAKTRYPALMKALRTSSLFDVDDEKDVNTVVHVDTTQQRNYARTPRSLESRSSEQRHTEKVPQNKIAGLFRISDEKFGPQTAKVFSFQNKMVVKIYTGSIVRFQGDALICSNDDKMSGIGPLAKAVAAAGGSKYSENYSKIKQKSQYGLHKWQLGEVETCNGGDLNVRFVVHAVIQSMFGTDQENLKSYRSTLMKIFYTINSYNKSTKFAMPLIGAGYLEEKTGDLQRCCQTFFQVLGKFFNDYQSDCRIGELHLINRNPKVTRTLIDIFKCNCTQPSEHENRSVKNEQRSRHVSFTASSNDGNTSTKSSVQRQHSWDNFTRTTEEQAVGIGGLGARPKTSTERSKSMYVRNPSARATRFDRKNCESYTGDSNLLTKAKSSKDNQSMRKGTEDEKKSSAKEGNLLIISDDDDDDERSYDETSLRDVPSVESSDDKTAICVICLDDVKDGMKLDCNHEFCKSCLNQSFTKHKKACPVCGKIFGEITGNQPPGDISFDKERRSLPGYEDCGTIIVKYNFKSGIQGPEHPNPGKSYEGTDRRGFLPDNEEGRKVQRLLKKAFDRRLVFTIGYSRTTGKDNVVTWNDIHHKTKRDTGAQRFGYPDPTYLQRVQEELAAKGVTE